MDFFESYLYSESNQSFGSGILGSWGYDVSESDRDKYVAGPRLVISPDDSNGTNPVEAWLSSAFNGDVPLNLSATVFDTNGSRVSSPTVDWSFTMDFNASDGNNSRVVQFEDALGNRDLNATGESVEVYLYSTLRQGVGSIKDFEIIAGGTGYANGDLVRLSGNGYGLEANVTNDANRSITDINVTKRGFGFSETNSITLVDENGSLESNGSGAVLKPLFFSGILTIEANTTIGSTPVRSSVQIKPSLRNGLNSQEKWLNKYLDSFMDYNLSSDNDGDQVTNLNEWKFGTNPLDEDTDLDDLVDSWETNESQPPGQLSNPLRVDTDNDGLSDSEEFNDGTNPRLPDTDFDGLIDSQDQAPLTLQVTWLFLVVFINQTFIGRFEIP